MVDKRDVFISIMLRYVSLSKLVDYIAKHCPN